MGGIPLKYWSSHRTISAAYSALLLTRESTFDRENLDGHPRLVQQAAQKPRIRV